MSGEGISTLAHRMINDVLRSSRRRFLTQVGAAGLGIGVPVSMTIAQEMQRSLVGDGKEVSLGEKLARYATSLRYEDLPEDVIRIAKRTILDTLGCAFGGYSAGPSKIAMKLASDVNSKQPGTILLSGIKTSPELAVFANGVMIRYLDFNDAYVSQMNGAGHPSDTIAALLTAGELSQRSGRDLITATVLAYEVYCKIGDVFDPHDSHRHGGGGRRRKAGGTNTGRDGARHRHHGRRQHRHAPRSCRYPLKLEGLCSSRRLPQGDLFSAARWERDDGPSNVFEGRYGFFKVMSRKPVAPPQLGEPFGIRRCFTKRFPLGQFSQTVAQAAVEARSYFKSPDEILEVNIHASRSAIKIMADGPDKWRPQTHETADHSIPYSAGLALMYGKIDPDYYEDPYLHDARLLDLVSRIKCLPSDEADQPELANLCELEVVLRSGVRKTVRVEYHRGHFKNPMTDAEMEEKFRLMAQKHLPADRVDNLLRIVWSVEKEPQVSNLIAATRV
jgi:2-methylcitrate dehydratase